MDFETIFHFLGTKTEDLDMESTNAVGNDITISTHSFPALLPTDLHPSHWKYVMRRSCQEIIPGLYLGPYACATKKALPEMQRLGVTHVVCIREIMEKPFIRKNHEGQFRYLEVELGEALYDNIIPHLEVVFAFLDGCLNSGGRALVHCVDGNSRSAALVIGYLMWRFGLAEWEVYFYVLQKRFCILPNEAFLLQLREFEPTLQEFQRCVLPALPAMTPSITDKPDGNDNRSMNNF